MTLADLLSQPLPDLATLRGHWIVFDASLLGEFNEAQEGVISFRAHPVELTDGRFALCADLLSEVGPGGIYEEPFSRLPTERFSEADILPESEILPLLPTPPTDE